MINLILIVIDIAAIIYLATHGHIGLAVCCGLALFAAIR